MKMHGNLNNLIVPCTMVKSPENYNGKFNDNDNNNIIENDKNNNNVASKIDDQLQNVKNNEGNQLKTSHGQNIIFLDDLLYKLTGFRTLTPVKWFNVFQIGLIHLMFLYSCKVVFIELQPAGLYTTIWGFVTGGIGGFGVTAGAHRLWTHRSYKAKTPLRVLLMLCYCASGQNTLYDWVRDHRIHHKYSETDADPHNSNRGFFFAHVGWLMCNKHPDVLQRGDQLDMSDILDDPVIQFHQKYFQLLKWILCFIIPTVVPMYFWNEAFLWAFLSQCVFRYVLNLNFTWLVNSAAHIWGNKPFDKRINPAENIGVSICSMGEGWHNYHHVFPWDYKAAELSYYFNITTMWIDLFSKIGWAYDLKQPSRHLIERTIKKYGDGTYEGSFKDLEEVPESEDKSDSKKTP